MTVINSTYDYSLSGGSLAGTMSLIKQGTRSLTLGMANSYSGGTVVSGGAVRVGNSGVFGSGAVSLNGGSLSSDGATARTVANTISLSSTAPVLGDTVNSGALNFSGVVDFTGSARDLVINSSVTFSGVVTNGSLDEKTGPGTLTYSGVSCVETGSGQWQIENGNIVISGGTVNKATGAIRIGNTTANGVSRMVITNGAIMNVTGGGQNARVGNDQAPAASATSTNILDVAGTFAWTTNSGGLMVIGSAGQFSQINLLSGGVLQINSFFTGTKTSELNLNGGTLSPTANKTNYLQGLTNAFVRSGGVTFNTLGFDIGVSQPLLDGTGGGGLTKIGTRVLSLNGVNTYTGLTTVSGGALGGTGVISGPVTVGATGTLAAGNSIGTLTLGGAATNNGTIVAEITNGPSADKIVFNGSFRNLGGTLTVTSLGTLANGTTYDLFDFNGGAPTGVAFAATNLPGGLSHWNTADLLIGGAITLVANSAPSAANFNLSLAVGGTVSGQVVGKFATDADLADVLTITSVSAPANGTVSIVGGTNITYVSTNSAASDSFTYTVSDGLASATATVSVNTYSPEGFNKLNGPTGSGPYSFSYLGMPGQNYALEESPNLVAPYTWFPVITNTAAGNGSLDYLGVPLTYPSGSFRTRHIP